MIGLASGSALSCPLRSSDPGEQCRHQISTIFGTSPTAFSTTASGLPESIRAPPFERRNDPAISSDADPLDIGLLAHVRRGLFGVAFARHRPEGDLAGLGSHICCEHLFSSCAMRSARTSAARARARSSHVSSHGARAHGQHISAQKLVQGHGAQQRQFVQHLSSAHYDRSQRIVR